MSYRANVLKVMLASPSSEHFAIVISESEDPQTWLTRNA